MRPESFNIFSELFTAYRKISVGHHFDIGEKAREDSSFSRIIRCLFSDDNKYFWCKEILHRER